MVALTGNEFLQVTGVQPNGLPSGQTLQCTTEDIANLAALDTSTEVSTALNTVGAGTITAAGIIGMNTSRGGAQLSAAFTDTTDTANLIAAALPAGAGTNTSFKWRYTNSTNAVATLAGGSGVTLSVYTVIPPNTFADYLVTRTGVSAFTFVGNAAGQLTTSGTFTITGATAVTVADAAVTTASIVTFTLKTVGGTVGAYPSIKTITTGTGFTVAGTTADVSVYNYRIS